MGYYFLTYYKNLLVLVFAALFVWELIKILSKSQVRLRDLAAFRYSPFHRKGGANLLILALLILGLLLTPAMNALNSTALLALNYSKASQGLTPNGTRFNSSGILNEEVLERAIEKGALENVTADDLKKALRVQPVVEGDSYVEEGYHISTQFTLSYQAVPETAHLDGTLVTQLVLQAYKEWFVDQYSMNVSSLDFDLDSINQNDYLDICEHLSSALDEVGSCLTALRNENVSFQSERTDDSFWTVISEAYSVRDVMLENLEAYILETGLSKEKGTYLGSLSFENVNLDFDAQKAQAANTNFLDAIAKYENDMAQTVLVPTYDENSQFYMSRTRIGVDDFASTAESYAMETTEVRSQISYNRYVSQMLLANEPAAAAADKADQMIEEIETELLSLTERAKGLVQEYSSKQANSYMTISNSDDGLMKILISNTVSALLAAVLLHLALYLKEVRKAMGGRR